MLNTILYTAASLTGLSRLILILLAAWAIYSLITRIIIPAAMRKYVSDFQQKFYQQNPQAHEAVKKKEGEVSIEYVDRQKTKENTVEGGEYVDFEELDEK